MCTKAWETWCVHTCSCRWCILDFKTQDNTQGIVCVSFDVIMRVIFAGRTTWIRNREFSRHEDAPFWEHWSYALHAPFKLLEVATVNKISHGIYFLSCCSESFGMDLIWFYLNTFCCYLTLYGKACTVLKSLQGTKTRIGRPIICSYSTIVYHCLTVQMWMVLCGRTMYHWLSIAQASQKEDICWTTQVNILL